MVSASKTSGKTASKTRTSDKKKRRTSTDTKRVRTPDARVTSPGDRSADAIGELLGRSSAPASSSRLRSAWRRLRWALILVPVLGVTAPGYYWLQYRSLHVTSKNAAVRGHLAEIGTRLSGLISAVMVDVGDRVVAGQVLAQLEDRHFRADVEEARAEVAGLERTIGVEQQAVEQERREIEQRELEARAEVMGLERTIEVEHVAIELEQREIEQRKLEGAATVKAADAQTETARIEAEDARQNHELRQSLSNGGGVSDKVVRDAEYAWLAAEAKLKEAQANAVVAAQSVGKGVRSVQDALTIRSRKIAVLEASLMGAQARLTRAKADLEDAQTLRARKIGVLVANLSGARARLARAEANLESAAIRAPADGAIVRRIVQPGASIDVGQPLLSMWLGTDIWVEAWIDEEDLEFVRLDNKATVTFHSFPGQDHIGRVDKIGLATDLELPDSEVPQPRFTRMRGAPAVGVRIRLDEPPPYLLPGLSAVVAIEVRTSASVD